MIGRTRKANTHSGTRAIEIPMKIRAKCGKCWGALKNATVPTTGRQATNAGLPMSGYVHGRTTSLPTRKCLRRRRRRSVREEIAERAVREHFFFFFFFFFGNFFLAPLFFPPSFARFAPLALVWFFLPFVETEVPLLSLTLCFPRKSAHYVVSCRKAKP